MATESTGATEPIHIVLASDENFAQHLAVVIASVLGNSDSHIVFHILHNGLAPETVQRIRSLGEGSNADFNFVMLRTEEFADLPSRPNISLMTYARMKIPALLPAVRRAIYLDCDMVVCRDIQELWDIDLDGRPVGACLDYASPHKVERLNIDPHKYFNAGMLLLDLDRLRDTAFNERVVAGLAEPERLFAHDQDFLNLLFKNNWRRIHSRWNLVVHHDAARSRRLGIYSFDEFREALASPGVIHYTGTKPSSYLHDSPFKQRYWDYLQQTPWRDYRWPKPTWKQIARKWRKRIKATLLRLASGNR